MLLQSGQLPAGRRPGTCEQVLRVFKKKVPAERFSTRDVVFLAFVGITFCALSPMKELVCTPAAAADRMT
jgi:hypothetical protein